MFSFRSRAFRAVVTALTCLTLSVPAVSFAEGVEENPSALRMTGDALVGRPGLLALTALGTATFLVSLPFSLLGGNVEKSANALVLEPAKQTFARCLGCIDRIPDSRLRFGSGSSASSDAAAAASSESSLRGPSHHMHQRSQL